MPPRSEHPVLVRIVEGIRGRVEVATELVLRFDYGASVPWVRRVDETLVAIAGPNAVRIDTPVELRGEDLKTVGEVTVSEGDRVPFVAHVVPVAPARAGAGRCGGRARANGGVLARVVRRLQLRRRVGRAGS